MSSVTALQIFYSAVTAHNHNVSSSTTAVLKNLLVGYSAPFTYSNEYKTSLHKDHLLAHTGPDFCIHMLCCIINCCMKIYYLPSIVLQPANQTHTSSKICNSADPQTDSTPSSIHTHWNSPQAHESQGNTKLSYWQYTGSICQQTAKISYIHLSSPMFPAAI